MIEPVAPSLMLIRIVGAVCLMLWSLKLVRLGVTRGFGASLKKALAASTQNRYLAFMTGAGVTTLLQSSTATIMLISSFAGQALVTTTAALALILGAHFGTTIVAQVMTFDLSWLFPLLLFIGYILFNFDKTRVAKNIGRIFIGIGLILLSLALIKQSAAPLQESQVLPMILNNIGADKIFTIFIAALLTWLAHSSLAIVLLVTSLTISGILPFELGLIIILGANLGGTIPPLMAAWRDKPSAKRIPVANTFMFLVSVILVTPFIDQIMPFLEKITTDPARKLVTFHMLFNLSVGIVFLPLVGIIANAVTKIFPDRVDASDLSVPRYLNQMDVNTPSVALSSAARETIRMAEYAQEMLQDTIKAFKTNDEALVNRIRNTDDIIDKLYSEIKLYMAHLSQESMDKDDADRYVQILTFATNVEHAGDIIDKNLMPLALKKIRNQGSFSTEGFKEIEHIHNLVLDSMKLAQNVFLTNDPKMARKMISDKEAIRQAEIKASVSHIERLRERVPETIATSSLHLDIIRDYRRINSYITTVAAPLIDGENAHFRTARQQGPVTTP